MVLFASHGPSKVNKMTK